MTVYEKLATVQNELKAPKGQYNSFGKYKYRSCEDILESAKPILSTVKCVVVLQDSILNIGDRFYVKATAKFIDAETGEETYNTAFAREDADKKGMDGSQITGTASSYARKYALNGLFLIDDTKDADTDAYHEQTTRKTENPKVDAAKAKAVEVQKLLVELNGGDREAATAIWRANYAKDKNDVVKMNAAIIELQGKLKQVTALDA